MGIFNKITKELGVLICFVLLFCLSEKRVLVWLCLEECGESGTEIENYCKVIDSKGRKYITDVSYERFTVSSTGELDYFNVTNIANYLSSDKIGLWPMITLFKAANMRVLINNPDLFISQCVDVAKKEKFTGFNIDIEPGHGVIPEDVPLFTSFVEKFAKEMAKHNVLVNIDFATWLSNGTCLWDIPKLNQIKELNSLISMDTYDHTQFYKFFDSAYDIVDHSRFGVGLRTELKPAKEIIEKELDYIIQKGDIDEIDIWRYQTEILKDPNSFWWDIMKKFIAS